MQATSTATESPISGDINLFMEFVKKILLEDRVEILGEEEVAKALLTVAPTKTVLMVVVMKLTIVPLIVIVALEESAKDVLVTTQMIIIQMTTLMSLNQLLSLRSQRSKPRRKSQGHNIKLITHA